MSAAGIVLRLGFAAGCALPDMEAISVWWRSTEQ